MANNSMTQELIDNVQEIENMGRSLAHTFVLSLAHDDMDTEIWERFQDLLKEIHSKANSASLLAAHLRISQSQK